MFQFLTHVELSRSMAAISEMPQYVAYQKNVVYALIKLSAQSQSFNNLCTMDGLSCPTICKFSLGNNTAVADGFLLLLHRRQVRSTCQVKLLKLCRYPTVHWGLMSTPRVDT